MSHVAAVDVEVKDLDALKQAVKSLGLEFKEGQTTHRWYGRWVNDYNAENAAYRNGVDVKDYGKCDHAIAVPQDHPAFQKPTGARNGTYEVGVVKDAKGPGYKLIYDNYQGGYGLEQIIGKNADNLKQAYTVKAAGREIQRAGYRVMEIPQTDGRVLVRGVA